MLYLTMKTIILFLFSSTPLILYNPSFLTTMKNFTYHYPANDGSTVDFNEPSDIVEFDTLIQRGIPPLALVLIIFSRSIELPDGSRQKVFSRWTKDRFRSLNSTYDLDLILAESRNLLIEYWAGYEFSNPIGLLIHRITHHAIAKSPLL